MIDNFQYLCGNKRLVAKGKDSERFFRLLQFILPRIYKQLLELPTAIQYLQQE